MVTKYTFTKVVNASRLSLEIQQSNIVTALDHIDTLVDTVDIWFKDTLSSEDESTLTSVVENHTDNPLEDIQQIVVTNAVALDADMTSTERAYKFAGTKLEGSSTTLVSHDFCDKTTWWNDSVRVTQETLNTSDNLTFTSPSSHINWIDLVSGKIPYEDRISNSYKTIVYVDDVTNTEATINYASGSLTFASSQEGKTIKATYSYATTSTWKIAPTSGKILKLIGTEIKGHNNFSMAEGQYINFQLYLGGYPYGPSTIYKTLDDFILCGDSLRKQSAFDASYEWVTIPFDYTTSKDLPASLGAEIRIKISNDQPINGQRGFVIARGVSVSE